MRRGLAVLALSLAPLAAHASPAQTFRDVAMFQGPSSHSPVVQSIPANAQIDVQSCGRTWCYGSWREIPGFVLAKALVFGGGGAPYGDVAPPPPYADAPPPPPVGVQPWGWAGGYSVGVGVGPHW